MKVKLIGKNLEDIAPLLERRNLEIVDGSPELLIAHGGDGALFEAERLYPGIPKLPLRDCRTAPLCELHSYEKQLDNFCSGGMRLSEMSKLCGSVGDHEILGMNDIFMHNTRRVNALRYRVLIDDELYANEIVGDGVGLATIHGSTAYYRSITHSTFRVGIGLAFSNSTELVNHLVIPDESTVRIKIIRGPAVMVADNSPDVIEVAEGEEAVIRKASGKALVYGLGNFMCQRCRLLRHPNKYPSELLKQFCNLD